MRKVLEFYCDYSDEVSSCYNSRGALEDMSDLIDNFYNFCIKLVGRDNVTYYEDSMWATMYVDVSDFDKAVINRLLWL